MNKKIKNKSFILCIVSIIACLSIVLAGGAYFAYSRNAQLFAPFSVDEEEPARAAKYKVLVDGKATNVIDFTAYATTKLSDIEQTGTTYKPHSFLPGAYQIHTITITNDSEMQVNCLPAMTKTTNDDRVFMAVLPETNASNLLSKLYTDSDLSTPAAVRTYVDSISYDNKDFAIGIGEKLDLTMIVWCEHDAVYSDPAEAHSKLEDLAAGVPSESYKLDCYFTQID